MAHLFRPKYTKPVPAGARVVRVRGVRYAVWEARGGRKVTWPLSAEDPTRYVGRVKVWWVRYKDHAGKWREEPASPDRMAAEARRVEIVRREERIRCGVLTPEAARAAQPAAALLAEWERAIVDAGASPGHAALYRKRAAVVLRHCGAAGPGELAADGPHGVTAVLARFRRAGVPPPDGTGRPLSAETSNHYLTAVRALVRWAVGQRLLAADPLAGCRKLNADARRTFQRRPLAPEEFDRLLAATAARRARCAVPGPDRAMAYLVDAYTGFRLKELSQLTPESFRLDESPPVVQLPASKGRPPVVQVLPGPVADRLREYLAGKPAGVRLWYGAGWARDRRASRVLRADLKAAGIPYKDAAGRVFNFHALRVQYATSLARAGVPLQAAQKLLRHSDPRLTANVYTRLGDPDLAAELGKLPPPG